MTGSAPNRKEEVFAMRRQTNCDSRSGMTLVELLMVISISGIVMVLVATSVRRVIDVESRMKSNSEWISVAAQLSKQLHQDVRQARDAEIGPDDHSGLDGLTLSYSNHRIEYRVTGDSIERTVHRDASITAREGFRIPQSAQVSWNVASIPKGTRFVDLQIRNARQPLPNKPLILQIVPRLGRDLDRLESEVEDES